MFRHEEILPKMKKLLRTSIYGANKKIIIGRKNISSKSSCLAASILYRLYYRENSWPFDFFVLYLDDALGARQWVDSDDDSGLFAKNICAKDVSTSAKKIPTGRDQNFSMVSALSNDINNSENEEEEEEILDEGSSNTNSMEIDSVLLVSSMPISPSSSYRADLSVRYRFTYCSEDVRTLLLNILIDRCKSQLNTSLDNILKAINFIIPSIADVDSDIKVLQGNTQSSNTWTIIATMLTFCEQYEIIRLLSGFCLERWMNNPAIGDYVKTYLTEIVGIISRTSHDRQGSQKLSMNVNIIIVREITKLRQKVKANQHDYYRSCIIDLAKINPQVATVIVSSLVEDDLAASASNSSSAGIRIETIKLIVRVLNTVKVSSAAASKGSNISSYSIKVVGKVFGESIQQLYENSWTISSSSTSTNMFSSPIEWNLGTIKTITEIVGRSIKDYGVKDFPFDSFVKSYLPSIEYRHDLIKQMLAKSLDIFNHVMFTLWNDLSSISQAVIGNELVVIERARSSSSTTSQTMTGKRPLENEMVEAESTSIAETPAQAAPSAARQVRPAPSSSNGGLFVASKRVVPMSNPALSNSSSFFRSSAPAQLSGNKMQNKLPSSMPTTSTGIASNPAPSASSSVSSKQDQSILTDEQIFSARQHHLYQLLHIHEEFASFLEHVFVFLRKQQFINIKGADAELGRTNPLLSSLGLSPESIGKFSSSNDLIDKNAAYRVRDYGCCSSKLLRSLVSIAQHQSLTTSHMEQAIGIIENVIERGFKTMYHGFEGKAEHGKSFQTILVDEISIIPALLSLSLIQPVMPNLPKAEETVIYSPPGIDIPQAIFFSNDQMSSNLEDYNQWRRSFIPNTTKLPKRISSLIRKPLALQNNEPTPVIKSKALSLVNHDFIPNFVHKKFYWRLCTSLYFLGIARPQSLGRYLWDHFPSVRVLLLMSMTSRYYYPPTVSSVDDRQLTTIGSNLPTIFSTAGAFYPKMLLNEQNKYMNIYRNTNGIDILIMSTRIDIAKGRLQDVQGALSELQDSLAKYYFSEFHPPNDADRYSVTNDRMTTRELRRRQEEMEAAEERRLALERKQQAAHQRSLRAANRGLIPPPTNTEQQVANILSDFASLISTAEPISISSSSSSNHKRARENGVTDEEVQVTSQRKKKRIVIPDEEAEFEDEVPSSSSMISPRIETLSVSLSELSIPASSTLYDTYPYGTQYTDSVEPSDLMLCNFGATMSPIPTDETILAIKGYDLKYNIGYILRECEDPDFIASAVLDNERLSDSSTASTTVVAVVDDDDHRQRIEQSLGWLIPAITVDKDRTLKRLPIKASAHILMMLSTKIYKRFADYQIWKSRLSPLVSSSSSEAISVYALKSTEALFAHLSSVSEYLADASLLISLMSIFTPSIHNSSGSHDTATRQTILTAISNELMSSNPERRHGAMMIMSYFQPLYSDELNLSSIQRILMLGVEDSNYLQSMHFLFPDALKLELCDYTDAMIRSITAESDDNFVCRAIAYFFSHGWKDVALQIYVSIITTSIHRSSGIIMELQASSFALSEMLSQAIDEIRQGREYKPYVRVESSSNKHHGAAFVKFHAENIIASSELEVSIDFLRAILLTYICLVSMGISNTLTTSLRGMLMENILATPLTTAIGSNENFFDILSEMIMVSSNPKVLDILSDLAENYLTSRMMINALVPTQHEQIYGISIECFQRLLKRFDAVDESAALLSTAITSTTSTSAAEHDDSLSIRQASITRMNLMIQYLQTIDPDFISSSATAQSLLVALETVTVTWNN
jgi:hypothetical protein